MKCARVWALVSIAGWLTGGCGHNHVESHLAEPVSRTGPSIQVSLGGRALTL